VDTHGGEARIDSLSASLNGVKSVSVISQARNITSGLRRFRRPAVK